MNAPDWDRALAPAEVKRLAPRDRGSRALASLERKVAAVEREADRPDGEGHRADLPTDRAKLRRWESLEERLWAWSDPTFDAPGGRNADLMARYTAALERLQSRKRRGQAGLRERLRAADGRIAALAGQVATLVGQNRELRVLLRQALGRGT